MRSTIVRTVIASLAVVAVALVVAPAEADHPAAACQALSAHHTATLGPNVDSVTVGPSTAAYWTNDCGHYIAQVDVPSTSSPKSNRYEKGFSFGGDSKAWDGVTKEECPKVKEEWSIWKKEGSAWVFKKGGTTGGTWVDNFGPAGCFPHQGETGQYDPPATGSDSYRILKDITSGSKHLAASAGAWHVFVPPK